MRIAIVSGTVFGTAEELAWHAKELLVAAGLKPSYQQQWELDALQQYDPEALLLISSTTGMGEVPERLQPLLDGLEERLPDWAGRPLGIVGLGDRGYGDDFCRAADALEELSDLLGLVPLQTTLRLDASETVNHVEDAVPWLQDFIELLKQWSN